MSAFRAGVSLHSDQVFVPILLRNIVSFSNSQYPHMSLATSFLTVASIWLNTSCNGTPNDHGSFQCK